MARSRLVKIGACKNEVLAMHGPSMTLLFVMLPTLADREGRLEDRPLRIKAEIFPYGCLDNDGNEVDVDKMLQWLFECEEHFIDRYSVDGKRYLQITNFDKHQSPHHKETESVIPENPTPFSCLNDARSMHDSCMTHAPKQVTSSKIKNKEGESEGKEHGNPTPVPFDVFWEAVHAKTGKQAAKKAYDHAVKRLRMEKPETDPHGFLLDRMTAFAASPRAHPADHTPIHPATWLNQGRYDDDPATWQVVLNANRGSPQRQPTQNEIVMAERKKREASNGQSTVQ